RKPLFPSWGRYLCWMKSRTPTRFCHIPDVNPRQASCSAFACSASVGPAFAFSAFFSAVAIGLAPLLPPARSGLPQSQEPRRVARDHQLLVRRDDPRGDPARGLRDARTPRRVRLLIHFDPDPAAPPAHISPPPPPHPPPRRRGTSADFSPFPTVKTSASIPPSAPASAPVSFA